MSTRVVERVDEWADRPFTDGYRELQDLADRDFSGVVRAGGAELFMTKGTVVGILRGDIEDFEETEGTIYEAPTPALPLLAVMQERTDEVRAQYYTEDTAISEVDGTLGDGGFTGFVELSENVLSGDYYLVYHQGHSMSVAFVGSAKRLLEGSEAFEQADDEVGIYEVRPVDIEPIEIPEPPEPEPEPEADSTTTGQEQEDNAKPPTEPTESTESAPESDDPTDSTSADETTADRQEESTAGPTDAASTTEATPATQSGASGQSHEVEKASESPDQADPSPSDSDGRAEDESETGGGKTEGRQERSDRADSSARPETATQSAESESTDVRKREPDLASRTARTETPPQSRPEQQSSSGQQRQSATQPREPDPVEEGGTPRPPRAESESGGHLETRAIPSLDPERTETVERSSDEEDPGARADAPHRGHEQPSQGGREQESGSTTTKIPDARPGSTPEPETTETEPPGKATETRGESEADEVDVDRMEELEAELEEKDEEIERLEEELETAHEETERLQAQLESVREERDDLAAEVERLEGELEQLESEFGVASDAESRITPQEALDGTDIFVRYHSKGDATLEKAHGSGTRRTDVEDNLRLEKHTQFDAATVAVGGQTYADFIEETLEYQFVTWAITELLFEIRDTGHENALQNLYDALPNVDRAELNGAVDVAYTEDGQETHSTETFDVVLRDRMGDPLLVADLNDSREAASEAMMEGLITSAERVGQTSEDFSAAFLVTRSFFEPGALETASEATRGGLLSRDKRKSFVNLSRKRGYHLCLVEARNQNFHLAVPEL